MTEKEFSQNLGIDIEIFEDGLFPDEAFFIRYSITQNYVFE
ncbi:Uncharacterised protein [Streptococcus pneumoniae]|nr:Uncharacterised protein [Streptococcus pneumoniae]CZD55270.1 Uncharacterised protein [Streptococcus pneumoniae]CZD63160.1 Uncharacterised protein [Streptococcus pneumoniae]VIT67321.1 Uncharacterised protein [Streptococcus pneumoniae]VIZ06349.1 Uncharacterised protein [Streptococcus pneumoniae]